MKKCPFCAEEIQDEALKCRHCKKLLNIVELKDYGLSKEDIQLTISKINKVDEPEFFEGFSFEMTSSMTAHVIADLVNPTYVYETFYEMLSEKLPQINWNKEYEPPHKNAMMDKLTVVYPHYFVNLEYEGVPFQFAMVNIGAKQKLFGKFENGKADPRIYKFYEDIKLGLKYLNDKKENYTSEKNKKRFNGVRKVENDEYQLYLVEKYNIKKNETLNKFVLNDKPYQDLIEVLNVAHNIEINNSDL